MFLITISPAHRRGERLPGQFVVTLDGRQLCISRDGIEIPAFLRRNFAAAAVLP